ncbi:hypothetical protein C8R45DRAFT_1068877 [Mycena sanguinolenta]|nr:hypothetical protein C8R45DRAFT_1068877 [Mycena sanguinolenta]
MSTNPGQTPAPRVRQYNRTPAPLTIPVIPQLASVSASNSPVTPSPSSVSSQIPLRAARRSQWAKVDAVLGTYGFSNVGKFLAVLFHPRIRGQKDLRTKPHRQAVAAFLQGRSSVKMAQVIELLYNHHKSRPKKNDSDQYLAGFSAHRPLSEIKCARPCLSSWATRLVGDHAYYRVNKLAQKQRGSRNRRHLRAKTNGRTESAEVVEWKDTEFTIQELAVQYQKEDPFLWYLTDCFTASRKKGQVIIKKTRPHPVIQVGAISSFIVSRNQYASGELGLPLGIWLFACQAHVDIKRVFCRFGFSVSDSTACNALNLMTESSLNKLRKDVEEVTQQGEVQWGKVLDNIQRYDRVFEHVLTGNITTISPTSISFEFLSSSFQHLSTEVSTHFRTRLAKRRLQPIQKVLEPLGTNTEREVENRGMQNALLDFDKQMGVEPDKSDNILVMRLKKILATTPNIYHSLRNVISTPETWHTKATDLNSCASNHYGPVALKDPSSLSRSSNAANMKRLTDLKKCDFYPTSCSMTLIWEARALDCWRFVYLFMKFGTHADTETRLILGCDSDLLTHFDNLASKKALPTLDTLLEQANIMREQYASQTAYERSLDKAEQDNAPPRTKFPVGSPWSSPGTNDPTPQPDVESEIDSEMPGLDDIPEDDIPECSPDENEPEATTPSAQKKDVPKKSPAQEDGPTDHKELPGFKGDRVLSNSILFLMEFGWWVELNYAVAEGDVGRVFEIFKIFVFTFAGTSNQNYMAYMLDLYALLEFECSPELKEALLNNWLFNLKGQLGKFLEGDLMQEWNNRWLEDIAGRRGDEGGCRDSVRFEAAR